MNKRDELVAYAISENPDIISITETWLDITDKHLISEISIPGYNTFLNCRESRKGGGVLLYVKDTIHATEIKKVNRPAYESLYINIKINRKHLILATIYRPPKTTLENDKLLYDEMEAIVKAKTSIVCGDFNLPHINWELFSSDNEGSRLLKLMKKLYISQFVCEPTLDNNLLDVILATDPDLISNCAVGEILANSDHKIMRCTINCEVDVKENQLLVSNYKKR